MARANLRTAIDLDEFGVQANAWLYLVDALSVGGRLTKALGFADEGLARFPRRLPAEECTSSLNPYTILTLCRGYCLSWLGHVREGLTEFGRTPRIAEEDGNVEVAGFGEYFAAEACFRTHDPERTLVHARRLEAINRQLGEPPYMVALSHLAMGYALLAEARAAKAVVAARAALAQRTSAEYVTAAAQFVAEALLAVGDLVGAETAALDAIARCQRSLRAIYEALAQGVLARALLRGHGIAAREPAAVALDAAAALIEHTGARTMVPALCEWRTEFAAVVGDEAARLRWLREASQAYAEIDVVPAL